MLCNNLDFYADICYVKCKWMVFRISGLIISRLYYRIQQIVILHSDLQHCPDNIRQQYMLLLTLSLNLFMSSTFIVKTVRKAVLPWFNSS